MAATGQETITNRMARCPSCGAGRVAGARDCWQCGSALPEPTPPRAHLTVSVRLPWVGVVPVALFFLPWLIASPHGGRQVVPVAGLELAMGWTFHGHSIPWEPLFWLIPLASAGLMLLLLLERRGTRSPGLWFLVALTAWAPVPLLLVKATSWIWSMHSYGASWTVRFVSGWYVLTCLAYVVAGFGATREWLSARRYGR